jgi:hypothetical protein
VKIESILGDGHCFFRALGYGLYDHHLANPNFIGELKVKAKETQDKDIKMALNQLIKVLPKGRTSPIALIQALRNLACTHNEKYHKERAEGDPKAYFHAMRSTNAHGGGPEIDALMEVLDIQICTSHKEAAFCGYLDFRPIITLEHSYNHFDLVNRVDISAKKHL